jgi:hypothetical protein
MITFEKPYIKKTKKDATLFFEMKIDNKPKKVWFKVDKKYEQYLCDDRIDAILIGMLSYAMRNGHNIKSESPMTEEIYFKITNYLIPILSKYDKRLKKIEIDVKTVPACKNAGAVGTGCSCGIDSIHSYLANSKHKEKQFKLTHLCINNVGAFNEAYQEEGIEKVRKERYKKAQEFADDVKLPLIITDSNFLQEIPQYHLYTHTYSSTFAILCLQKLWRTYYYASLGHEFSMFSVVDTAERDPAYYEILSLDCFSTNNMKIYSEAAAYNRLEKTEHIYQSDLLKKHLHVCIQKAYNCSTCSKCRRTLLSFYALGADMHEYDKIFDIDYFEKNIDEYFWWIFVEHQKENKLIEPIYNKLMKKKNFAKYVEARTKEIEYSKRNEPLSDKDYKEKYEQVIHSKTYKAGNVIMFVPRKIKSMISKLHK